MHALKIQAREARLHPLPALTMGASKDPHSIHVIYSTSKPYRTLVLSGRE